MANFVLFQTVFPEFAQTTEPAVDYWLGVAATTLDPWRLGQNADLACMLFAAHNLTLGALAAAAAAKGQPPGALSSPIASKGAAGLSVAYDTTLTAIEGAGVYNGTSYGQRLWKMLEAAAMGGVYRAPPPRRRVFGFGQTRGWL